MSVLFEDLFTYWCGLTEEASTSGSLSFSKGLVGNFGNINSLDVDLGGGGQSVDLVDTLDWKTVNTVRASDKEKSRWELPKEHDSLATVSTGKKHQDAARFESLSKFGGGSLACSNLSLLVVSGVPLEVFDH